ncbi:Beta-lactamase superfamily domain-containing protein [Ceratobasidium theobromae]|uniref:Beta-lactamase superfamily domain-containing protein n=1 Tax=Ceratobasidium theobromae TaxID=1582974 RepID=A0A5N5QPD9_9AGAM|nr:Beta-lactamase superfamily domain-containing protein [Ceratobasidium theobromae]
MPVSKRKNNESESDSEEETQELVDVDFEFFGPTEIDFLALKRLLNQLFSSDSSDFHIEKLVELILSQPGIGSTVKTDGPDSDPYAILTAINVNENKDHPSIRAIMAYLMEKVTTASALGKLLSPQALSASAGHTGLIISERLINMPPQIMPPMYKMLGDELQNAIDQNEPYLFDNYIVISRCFRFDDDEENATGTSHPSKKQKRKGGALRSYHAEDECIGKVAYAKTDYEYNNSIPREEDSFGVDLAGRVMAFPRSRFAELVSLMQDTFPPGRIASHRYSITLVREHVQVALLGHSCHLSLTLVPRRERRRSILCDSSDHMIASCPPPQPRLLLAALTPLSTADLLPAGFRDLRFPSLLAAPKGCPDRTPNYAWLHLIEWLLILVADCAEGTERQMLRAKLKIGRVQLIFITHLHMDHCMGIAPLMSTLMSPLANPSSNPDSKRLDVFGPPGLRELLRTILKVTQTSLSGKYAVHELLSITDIPFSCELSEMHPNETAGKDFRPSPDGYWKDIFKENGWAVHAGSIKHRGYVFEEAPTAGPLDQSMHIDPLDRNAEALAMQGIRHPRSLLGQLLRTREPITLPDGMILTPPPLSVPGRKLVLLGDTCDPWAMKDLSLDPSLLVHEATNAYIPPEIDPHGPGKKETDESVKQRAILRGHSTPGMAGAFAKAIGAKRLVLNHFGARFVAPDTTDKTEKFDMMVEIERQASSAWGAGQAIAAYDLMCIDIPAHVPST